MSDNFNSIELDAHLAKAGPAAESFARLWDALWQQSYVAPELLELCRLTLARLHGIKAELDTANPKAPPLDAARRQAVLEARALEDVAFSEGEKAILLFAEYYWVDAQSITDEVADAVKAQIGEAGLVFLIEALGCMDARIRTAACLRDLATAHQNREPAHVG